jgi:hypothetical protein
MWILWESEIIPECCIKMNKVEAYGTIYIYIYIYIIEIKKKAKNTIMKIKAKGSNIPAGKCLNPSKDQYAIHYSGSKPQNPHRQLKSDSPMMDTMQLTAVRRGKNKVQDYF